MNVVCVFSWPLGRGTDGVWSENGFIFVICCMCIWTAKEKGKSGVKPLFFFREELFTSTSKHLWLKWRRQELIFNVICVDC